MAKTFKTIALIWELFLILGVLAGTYFLTLDDDTIVVGIVVFVGGLLFACVSGMVLTGFGIIVENAQMELDEKKKKGSQLMQHPATAPVAAPKTAAPHLDIVRGEKTPGGRCAYCKQWCPELWECIVKNGTHYRKRKMCQNCIELFATQ